MKSLHIFPLILLLFLASCKQGTVSDNTISEPVKTESSDVKELVWSDEFDKPGSPDTSKWVYDIGGHGWGNEELEYYTDRPENVRVEDGHLII